MCLVLCSCRNVNHSASAARIPFTTSERRGELRSKQMSLYRTIKNGICKQKRAPQGKTGRSAGLGGKGEGGGGASDQRKDPTRNSDPGLLLIQRGREEGKGREAVIEQRERRTRGDREGAEHKKEISKEGVEGPRRNKPIKKGNLKWRAHADRRVMTKSPLYFLMVPMMHSGAYFSTTSAL